MLINHAYRYNTVLGEVVLGMRPDGSGGYAVASRAGRYIQVPISDPEDPDLVALAQPYVTLLSAYNNTVIGQTTGLLTRSGLHPGNQRRQPAGRRLGLRAGQERYLRGLPSRRRDDQ